MNRRPRKIITRVIVFLLLGAIVNVAVAWSFVWISSPMYSDGAVAPPPDVTIMTADDRKPGLYEFWRLARCDRLGAARYTSMWATPDQPHMVHQSIPPTDFLSSWADNVAPRPTKKKNQYLYRGADARGWPMLSMYSWWDGTAMTTGGPRASSTSLAIGNVHLGFRWALQNQSRSTDIYAAHVFPVGIIPIGFLLNSILYAACVFVVLQFVRALVHEWRIKRGLCPACAYPVGTSPVCTECGEAVMSRKEAAPDERARCDTSR